MKLNVGSVDRFFRVALGAVGLWAGYSTYSVLWGVVGGIVFLSGLVGFCPIYRLFGVNTREGGSPKASGPQSHDETII